jgi:hypothetical protein
MIRASIVTASAVVLIAAPATSAAFDGFGDWRGAAQ